MRHADVAVVVTNPEVSSVRDSDRIIGLLDSKTHRAEKGDRMEKHLLLTRYDPTRAERGEMLKVEDVLEILSIPLLGIIPESEEVLQGLERRLAGHHQQPGERPARAYLDAVRRLARRQRGDDDPERQEGPARQALRTEGCMNLLNLFTQRSSAPVARERLQILLAHERGVVGGQPDLVAMLREEILEVIAKHVAVDATRFRSRWSGAIRSRRSRSRWKSRLRQWPGSRSAPDIARRQRKPPDRKMRRLFSWSRLGLPG